MGCRCLLGTLVWCGFDEVWESTVWLCFVFFLFASTPLVASCSCARAGICRVVPPAPPAAGYRERAAAPDETGARVAPQRGTHIMVGAAAAALSLCAVVAMSRCSPRLPPPPASIAAAVHFYRPSSHLLVQTLPPTLLALTSLRAHPNPTNRAARRPPPPRPSTYTQHSQPGSARPPRHSPGSGGHGGSPTSSQPAAPPGHPRAAAAAGARTPPAGPYLPPAVAAS